MTSLEHLDLAGQTITDDGFCQLSELVHLKTLQLNDTLIGDKSLDIVSSFKDLEWLDLSGLAISDIGLRKLTSIDTLKHLEFDLNDNLTLQGAKGVQSELPDCQVVCWESQPNGSKRLVDVTSQRPPND
ncbi:MAG: hypothetical protein R3C03_09955 [Pirellulaceae bacterium]